MTKKFIGTFFKFQLVAMLATIVDFTVTILLKEGAGMGYLFGTSIGSFTGGITNFILVKGWVFQVKGPPRGQHTSRFLITWVGSILLNISIVFFFTGLMKFDFISSKIVTAIIIGLTFSYSVQKKYVFGITKEIFDLTDKKLLHYESKR